MLDKKFQIDWDMIIQRNIIMKLDRIFEAMGWDISEVIGIEPKKEKIQPKPKKSKKQKIKQEAPKSIQVDEEKILQGIETKTEITPFYEE